jgi:hypothetical protein
MGEYQGRPIYFIFAPGGHRDKDLRLMVQEIEGLAVAGHTNYRLMLTIGIPKEKLIHVFHLGEPFKWLKKRSVHATSIASITCSREDSNRY